jgi:thymidylate synthase ThyX
MDNSSSTPSSASKKAKSHRSGSSHSKSHRYHNKNNESHSAPIENRYQASSENNISLHIRLHQVASLDVLVGNGSYDPANVFSTLRFRALAHYNSSIDDLLEKVKEGFTTLLERRSRAKEFSQSATADLVFINEDLE